MTPPKRPPNVTPCYGSQDIFFSSVYAEQMEAKRLCIDTCDVRVGCLTRALRVGGSDPYIDGVQGGFDARERGYYKRLFPGKVTEVQVLPPRYVTKDPKAKKKGKRAAA